MRIKQESFGPARMLRYVRIENDGQKLHRLGSDANPLELGADSGGISIDNELDLYFSLSVDSWGMPYAGHFAVFSTGAGRAPDGKTSMP